ncbi:MAG TPA: leucyl aminopeptidase [Marmoricola sp.]|nr:leucyl aminopeptidase [Marmoricola sp.]
MPCVTTYSLRKGSPDRTGCDLVVIGVAQQGEGSSRKLVACPGGEPVADAWGRKFTALLSSMGFKGGTGEVLKVPTGGTIRAGQLLAVGVGSGDALTPEKVRRAAGVAARNAGNAASVALALPAHDAEHVRAVAEGYRSGSYAFTAYKKAADRPADVVILSDAARRKDAQEALERAGVVGAAVAQARDWINLPANELTPEAFGEQVSALVGKRRRAGLSVEVVDTGTLRELGCGGILGVGLSSANLPCLVKVTWEPKDVPDAPHVALVGKGITYDSGGLTIKPGASMTTMKCDMSGAAAVVGAVIAAADLALPVRVTAWAPMAENMISGQGMRPGDVLTMYGGRTVEVRNTDAEGRLVLADALSMAVETGPEAIVEVSTLTGACHIALGDRIAGLFGDDDVVASVERAAATSGEQLWRLPIPERTSEQIRNESEIADLLQHNWVRWGGALWAAAFVKEFAGGLPFAHLDIAGPAFNSGAPWGHVPSGGTGFALATLVDWLEQRSTR